jgi:phosphoglycerol transferase MdoB-like AlkP superfamily enzyme
MQFEALRKSLRCILIAAVSAGAGVFIGELLINRFYFKDPSLICTSGQGLTVDIVILLCSLLVLVALVNRLVVAIVAGLAVYALIVFSDILKLLGFDTPLRPVDLQYFSDLQVLAKSFVSFRSVSLTVVIFAVLISLVAVFWRKERAALSVSARLCIGVTATILLIAIFVLPGFPDLRRRIEGTGIALPEWYQYETRTSAQLNGLLVDWALTGVDFSFKAPERYDRPEVERIANSFRSNPGAGFSSSPEPPPDLILFIVESFMDPLNLGLQFTADPIPTFHAIGRQWSSGNVVVPVFGGTSANTEFELLTGLSMYFLPDESCPYRQYLTRDIPSLPRLLHKHGYRTIAIPADPPYLFNRRAAFRHLGFDSWLFPEADPKTPRTPDDEFASDEAIVDSVINAARGKGPFFAMTFTGGTHFPWEYPNYLDSDLDIVNPLKASDRSKLKTYINALRVEDKALKKLIAHFEKADRKTVILVLGDHLPPLGETYDATNFFKCQEMEKVQKRYQVPAVVWSNFPAAKEDFRLSANFVPAYLLRLLGLSPEGSLALSSEVCSKLPVFSRYLQTSDGRIFPAKAANIPFLELVSEYQTIQYDLLKGRQYALKIPGWGW